MDILKSLSLTHLLNEDAIWMFLLKCWQGRITWPLSILDIVLAMADLRDVITLVVYWLTYILDYTPSVLLQ